MLAGMIYSNAPEVVYRWLNKCWRLQFIDKSSQKLKLVSPQGLEPRSIA